MPLVMRRTRPYAARTRGPSPRKKGVPLLEVINQPFYDNVVFDQTTSGELTFFQDPTGSNGKTLLDTNLEKGGSLPHPRVFDLYEVELVVSQALSNRTTGLPANEAVANQTSAWFNTIKAFFYSAHFRLLVGTKEYFKAPAFLLPSNNMIEGSVFGLPVQTAFANGLRTLFGQSVGMKFSSARRRIRIPPDQVFKGTLTLPTAIDEAAGGSGHVVYCVLHGINRREVM